MEDICLLAALMAQEAIALQNLCARLINSGHSAAMTAQHSRCEAQVLRNALFTVGT